MNTEIESIPELRRHLELHGDLRGAVVQGLDLRGETELLLRQPAAGAVFLGCALGEDALEHVTATGGVVFPGLPGLPYHPYRSRLYTPDELMAGYRRGAPESHRDALDQRIYAHFDRLRRAPGPLPILEALAQRLHDHAIDDALHDLLSVGGGRQVIAIMGGHAMLRTDTRYRDVARIARILSRHDDAILMASGGGPGAMEACHLGAMLAAHGEPELDRALEILSVAPSYRDPLWLDTALEVRELSPEPRDSLSIPTWFYGHEPPNLFATHIAKYFSNSLREDGLLAIAKRGVVYAPGSAGTVQEIFMDAAQNHYGTFGDVSPMIFLGRRYWTEVKPILPLLESLSRGRQYADMIALCDGVDEVVERILALPPVPYLQR